MSSQALTPVIDSVVPQTDFYNLESTKTTNCIRCNRKLTSPGSVAAGIGPVCSRNVAYETRRKRESPSYVYTSRTFTYLERKDSTIISFSSKPTATSDMLATSKSFLQPKIVGKDANGSVTYCSCCERHGVTSQVKSWISSEIGQILSVCDDCQQADCDLTNDHCLFEQFNRPSPVSKFFS